MPTLAIHIEPFELGSPRRRASRAGSMGRDGHNPGRIPDAHCNLSQAVYLVGLVLRVGNTC